MLTKRLEILSLFLIPIINTFAQISPGDLSRAHSQYEGISNCTRCHELGEQLSAKLCRVCHKEIDELIKLKKGYHSSGYVKGKNCWDCHGEHAGRDFQLIKFDEKNFNHSVTGFDLTGKHQNIKCRDCHQQKNILSVDLKKRKNTFLGLTQNCSGCHEDYHQNTLAGNCNTCHNTTVFRPAANFSHYQAKFKLLGNHQKVECIKCHLKEIRNGKEFQKFTGLNFNNCSPCHKDVHNGRMGNDCKKCHVVSGFQFVDKNLFDHNKTNFPLLGKHFDVSCDKCHKGNIGSKPVHDKCIDCHKDFHQGQFISGNLPRDCSECHLVEGFSPSNFTMEKHNELKFVLEGSHKAVDCGKCHLKESNWQFRFTNLNCNSCHPNPHGKEISDKFMQGDNCSKCHNTDSWNKIEFDHAATEFALAGKHTKIGCESCHFILTKSGEKEYHFASLNKDCESCHKDIHLSQFKLNDRTDCSRCHTTLSWVPEKFDHRSTKFPLEGAHKKVECRKCHKQTSLNGIQFVNFKIQETKCSDCHS